MLKYFFPRDAKMSLGSQLLKHLYIKESCDISWDNTKISIRDDGKPCYLGPGGPIEFNVSHQAGLVALIGARSADVDLGIDIVCVNERNDEELIRKDGLFAWIDMHADVFAPEEIWHLKHNATHLYDTHNTLIVDSSDSGCREIIEELEYRPPVLSKDTAAGIFENAVIDAKLRRFYTLWCLREAYVKMTGEALLAPWLQKLRFKGFGVPMPHLDPLMTRQDDDLRQGGYCEEFEIWFDGKTVRDTKMRIDAFGSRYMVASAVRYKDRRELDGMKERATGLNEYCLVSGEDVFARAKS